MALASSGVQAATIDPPVQIGTSNAQNPTLGVPRWKGWVHPAGPDTMWAVFANASSSANNMVFTHDGGLTWSDEVINPDANGHLDYHVSVFGKGGDLFLTFPNNAGIATRRLAAPATSNDDRQPQSILPATTGAHRSNIMVDGDGRVWAFTRRGDHPSENVRYHYSDDDGATWVSGLAVATGAPDIRIGSMPYVDGRACLVVLHLNDDRGYEYYLWNGTDFEALADSSIMAMNMGYSRSFTHNVVGETFHLVHTWAGELRHVWKDHAGGTGAWNEQVIDSHPDMDDMSWGNILTTRGDELYLFYCRWDTNLASSAIWMRTLDAGSSVWSEAELVSGTGLTHNIYPNTSFRVPVSSSTIPVFWTSGLAADAIQFARVTVDTIPVLDQKPPAEIQDLEVTAEFEKVVLEVTWTSPGDDGMEGSAASYDLRYAQNPLHEGTWDAAIQIPGEPVPAPAGTRQSMIIDTLPPGASYLLGIRAQDEAGNESPVSNIIWVRIGDVSAAGDVPGRVVLGSNYPNPFNPATTLRFSLPRADHVRLAIYDGAGRLVREVLGEWRGPGDHEVRWNGRDQHGREVASGVYYSRLEVADAVITGTLTLVR